MNGRFAFCNKVLQQPKRYVDALKGTPVKDFSRARERCARRCELALRIYDAKSM